MLHIPNFSNPKTAALRLAKTLTALALLALLLTMSTGNVSLAQSDVPDRPDRPQTESLTHESITFTWGPPHNNRVTGYQILRQEPMVHDSDYYDIVVATTGSRHEAGRTYTDTTINPLWEYRYRVRAISDNGMSVKSYSLRVRTPPAPDYATQGDPDTHDPNADLGSIQGVPVRAEVEPATLTLNFTEMPLEDRSHLFEIDPARTDRLEHAGSKHAYKFTLENDKIYIVHIDTPPQHAAPEADARL